MEIRIYQVDPDRDAANIEFEPFSAALRSGIDPGAYDCVFDGDVKCSDLEEVYGMFNRSRPDYYPGRSMSVSDIVEVRSGGAETPGFYYCDVIGFSKMDEFDPAQTRDVTSDTMRVLVVEPGKEAYVSDIGKSVSSWYDVLGCEYVESCYPFSDNTAIVCDDEGKINGSMPCRAILSERGEIQDIMFGKFFICACGADDFGSLSEEQVKKYAEMFRYPERIYLDSRDRIVVERMTPAGPEKTVPKQPEQAVRRRTEEVPEL